MNRQTADLLAELMGTADAFHVKRGSRVQDPEDMRRRLAAALSMPSMRAEELAADVETARHLIATTTLPPSEYEAASRLRGANEMLAPVAPFLRGSDWSDRDPPPLTWRERCAAFFLGRRPA